MTEEEAGTIIESLKAGQSYFKPLPYHEVEGGTTITYDPEQKKFKEYYLNRSIWDRGTEEYTKYRSEKELLTMFLEQDYTDRKYMLPKKSEDYEMK